MKRKLILCCVFVFPCNILSLLLRRIIKAFTQSVFEVFLNAWSHTRSTGERKSLAEERQKQDKERVFVYELCHPRCVSETFFANKAPM